MSVVRDTSALGWRSWPFILLIVIVLVGGATRFALSRTHFAHADDIGVAASILTAKADPPSADDLLQIARSKKAEGSASPRVALLLDLERRGLWRPLHAIAAAVYPYVVVPLTWTYAPLQFFLTGVLVHPGQGYETVKFWGRLPSVLFSILSIVLVSLSALRLGKGGAAALAAMAASLVAFSGEHTTTAALMHSYAATSAASAALLLLVLIDARPVQWSAAFIAKRSLILISLLYLSYQTVMLLPGYFAALGIGVLKRSRNPEHGTRSPRLDRMKIAMRVTLLLAIVGLAFVPAYVFRVAGISAITFSAGPNHEFVFGPGSGMLTRLSDAVQFLAVNSWIVLKSLVSPVPDDSWAATAIAGVVAIGLLVGLTRMIAASARRFRWPAAAAAGIHIVVTLVVFYVFVLTGRLALAPTRHVLVYLPVIVIPAAYGLRTMAVWIVRSVRLRADLGPRTGWVALSTGLSLIVMAAYVGHLPTLFMERRDAFDETHIRALAQDYQVDFVAADNAAQLFAMPSLSEYAPVHSTSESSRPSRSWLANRLAPRRLLLVSQNEPLDEPVCVRLRALLVAHFGLGAWERCMSHLRILHSVSRPSDVEAEFSQRTRNGTNALYANVIELIEPPPAKN